jgi:general L-amino acid transport system permease protein
VAALPLAVFAAGGAPLALDLPALRGFNFQGGQTMSPEFAAILFGLVFYSAAFMAETIRAGILGIRRGQIDAAQSLGLGRLLTLRLVVLPQAMRIIVPPLTSQYLSLTKSSSLAVAVGYPDLMRVYTVVTADTGRPIECIAVVVAVYLTLSLLTALAMNLYNRRIAVVER